MTPQKILRCAPLAAALLISLAARAQEWYAESPTHPPAARRFHSMFAMGRDVFLFGGVDELRHDTFGDTWRYDGQQWHREHGKSPGARSRAALAADSAGDRAVLFGGADASGNALGDTWTFDGQRWRRVHTPSSPPARLHASMAFDQPNGCFVLFGGMAANGAPLGDTWVFDGVSWQQRTPATSPAPRLGHTMAYDQLGSRTLLFGGWTSSSTPANTDTWTWNGFEWQQLATQPVPAMVFPAMLWHAAHGVAVLTGSTGAPGSAMVTRVFDGSDWTQGPAMAGIAGRQGHAMAFDALREVVVLFGGATVGHVAAPRRDTWELSTRAELHMLGGDCGASPPAIWSRDGATPRLGSDLTMLMAPVRGEPMLLAGYGLVAPGPQLPGCVPAIDAYVAQPMVRMGQIAVLEMPIPGNRVLLGTVMYLQGFDLANGSTEPVLSRVAELRLGN